MPHYTCREEHALLLAVPQKERGTAWHQKVSSLFEQKEFVCTECANNFLREIFKDESDQPNTNELCHFCLEK